MTLPKLYSLQILLTASFIIKLLGGATHVSETMLMVLTMIITVYNFSAEVTNNG